MGAIRITQFGGVLAASSSGAPEDGTSGTGAGVLPPGSLYMDEATGTLYSNTGTAPEPVWQKVGTF